ncbi:winged helix-turn-helix domain-containing protein [Methanobrevibacter sp.]
MDDEALKVYAYVTSSMYRTRALNTIGYGMKTPFEIAREADVPFKAISTTLKELKHAGVVECINEDEVRNRLYRLTDLGADILEFIEDHG